MDVFVLLEVYERLKEIVKREKMEIDVEFLVIVKWSKDSKLDRMKVKVKNYRLLKLIFISVFILKI